VPAAEVIRVIRQYTSEALFDEYPRLAKENPSGQFWATGYMAVHGRRLISSAMIARFLRYIRDRQGVEIEEDLEADN
jgi:hypothetical protein